MKCKSSTTS